MCYGFTGSITNSSAVHIHPPNNNKNGRYPEGTSVQYQCVDGYSPIGGNSEVRCASDGSWKPSPPSCAGEGDNPFNYPPPNNYSLIIPPPSYFLIIPPPNYSFVNSYHGQLNMNTIIITLIKTTIINSTGIILEYCIGAWEGVWL